MNIIIAGGGTAGWIAAYFINNAQPNMHNITVIESSQIGIVGAGEAAAGSLFELLDGGFFNKKIPIQDFINSTDATTKMGIRHTNWAGKNESYFAPIDLSPTTQKNIDYIFNYVLHKYGPSKIHLASRLGIRYENNQFDRGNGLHFDGHKVGKFFKEHTIGKNVSVIDAKILKVNIGADGRIESLFLDNDQTIEGDLFIDCTGFRRVLISETDAKWKSVSDVLTVNSAMPFIEPYADNNNFIPETGATALSSGWMFDIPLKTRRGMGYIYDNNFISDDDAKPELEKKIGHEVEPIKIIRFDTGYFEKSWNKNVLSLGLASSFLEPLEATSIHNTIAQLHVFVNHFFNGHLQSINNELSQQMYNKLISRLNETSIDFISLHYQGKRNDSEFWQNIYHNNLATDTVKEIVNVCQYRIPTIAIYDGVIRSYGIPLAKWNMVGLGLINEEQALTELMMSDTLDIAKTEYDIFRNTVLSKMQILKST